MVNYRAGVTLSFVDMLNTANTVQLSTTQAFTQVAEQDIVSAAAGSQSILPATMSAADMVLVFAKSGDVGVKLDGEAAAHVVKSGGFLLIDKAAATGVTVSYADAAKAKAVLLT